MCCVLGVPQSVYSWSFCSTSNFVEQTTANCTDMPALLGVASIAGPLIKALRSYAHQMPTMKLCALVQPASLLLPDMVAHWDSPSLACWSWLPVPFA